MPPLALFAIGAILAFAIRSDPSGIDLTAVGVILMVVSVAGISIMLYRDQWRRRMVEETIDQGGTPPPMPIDDTVLVDPSAPIQAPSREALYRDLPERHHPRDDGPVVSVRVDRDR
jgi:hypothetical protein